MLIVFPLAFFIGTFVFDLLGVINKDNVYFLVGFYLNIAGIVGAVAAAIPGTIDYFTTVPPNSSAKKRGAKHGIINVINLVLFIAAFLLKRSDNANTTLTLIIEAIGVVLLFFAGWMGGTLVYRNQIGVDPRYAHAGKWKELHLPQKSGAIEVASVDELKTNQMKLIHAADKRIVLAKTETGYAAFEDRCSHKGASLAGGSMICGTVQCPWHGSQFDVKSGAVKAGPAEDKIAVYTVTENNGKVFINL